jgi:peptidoglycan glycosyltransferase
MVSKPTFDPNPISAISEKTAKAGYEQALKADGRPLVNRAIANTYPPGSIFKVVTASAYFDKLGKTPADKIASPPQLKLPLTTQTLSNFGGGTCGGDPITIEHALEVSCNTAFANIGLEVGADALQATAEGFGFNQPFDGFPLANVRSVFPPGIDKPQTAISAIGQFDVRVTPLQMALVAAGIANRGSVMRPYIVDEVLAPNLKVIERAAPKTLRAEPAVSERTAAMVSQMMQTVVRSGSGRRAQIPGVAVAGKTGTAQNAEGSAPHAWFIGFAPADDPQIAVAIFIEGGDTGSAEATGGVLAAPMAKAMMEAALRR